MFYLARRVQQAKSQVCVTRSVLRLYSKKRTRRLVDVLENDRDEANVTVHGFVQSVRKQKKIAFAALIDGSSVEPLQAVLQPEQAENLSTGTAVSVTGRWIQSPSGKKQVRELQANEVVVLGQNDAAASPIQKKYQSQEFLRTVPHLRPRIPHNALLLRLRSQVIASLTNFFDERGFVQVHPPIITSSDCEGAGEVFTIEAPRESQTIVSDGQRPEDDAEPFFRTTKYLTVSSQLHLEALAMAVKNVWTLSPTFRAEKSDTARHLSEFYMLEAEMAFVDDANEVMDVIENMVKYITQRLVGSRVGRELLSSGTNNTESDRLDSDGLQTRWETILHGTWPRITYYQACQHISKDAQDGKASFDKIPNETSGLDTEHERYIAETVGKGGPVFVTDYPKEIKPFYMAPSNAKSSSDVGQVPTVACWDLLMPDVCEVVGGSMREHRLEELENMMAARGLAGSESVSDPHNLNDTNNEKEEAGLQWYLDLRRYGSVPHGGFGLGFDRLLGYLAGVSNIRDVRSEALGVDVTSISSVFTELEPVSR